MAQLSGRIVSDDNEFKAQLGRLMRSGAIPVSVASDGLSREGVPPDVIVADLRGDATTAMISIEQLRAWAPTACIVAVALQADPTLILRAMRAGVNEFLVWPPTDDAFNEAIRHAASRRAQAQEIVSAARTLVFFGAKGGAGTTTVAVNSGVDVARMSKKPTVIVDLKPGLGEVALFLGVRPKYSLLDAIDNLPRLDKHMLSSLVVKHKSGLDILAGSDQFDRPAQADASAIGEVFRVLARNYEYILVDGGNQINQQSVAALGVADEIFLIVSPDVPSIRNAQRLLNRLRQLGAHKDRVRILLNRAAEPYPIPPKQIEGALGHPIHQAFASDYKVVSTALNSGVPLAQTGKSDLAAQFDRFTRDLLGPEKEEVAAVPQKKVAGLGRIGWVW
jgi:pilus assembly protein CpaE